MTGDRTRRWPPEENCYCGGPEWTLYPHRRGTGLYCRRDAAEPAATMDHTPDPRLSELVARAVAIDLPTGRHDILDALDRIRGDLDLALIEPYARDDLEREFGNLVVSSLRWMVSRGLDPADCIAAAEAAQRAYAARPRRETPPCCWIEGGLCGVHAAIEPPEGT